MDGVDEGKKKEQISSICQMVGRTGHFAFTTSSHVICLSLLSVCLPLYSADVSSPSSSLTSILCSKTANRIPFLTNVYFLNHFISSKVFR